MFAIVIAVLVALLVAVMLLGGGEHGPGRHLSTPTADNDPAARESVVAGANIPRAPARVSLGTPR